MDSCCAPVTNAESAWTVDHKETLCLQFTVPYGNTTFNQLQIPVLMTELRSPPGSKRSQTHEKRRESEGAASFIEQARGRLHTCIKFFGD